MVETVSMSSSVTGLERISPSSSQSSASAPSRADIIAVMTEERSTVWALIWIG